MKFKIQRRSDFNSVDPPVNGAVLSTDEKGNSIWVIEIESLEHFVRLANEETWGGLLVFTNHRAEDLMQEIEVFDTE